MSFVLTRAVLSSTERVQITADEYGEIKSARDGVVEVLSVEEKFDFLMGNYRDLEVGLLSLATDDMLFGETDWSKLMDDRNRVARLVSNLLSSCRMYLDHLGHHLSSLFGAGSEQAQNATAWARREYDTGFAYRFMEAHRNYTQHRGDAVHRMSYTWKRLKADEAPGIEYSVHPIVDVGLLRSDKKFKAAIIAELDNDDSIALDKKGGLELKPLVREYIQSIARIHGEVRKLIESHAQSWELSISNAIKRFQFAFKTEKIQGLAAARLHVDGYLQDIVPIFDDLVRRRRMFVKRNPIRPLGAVSFVTGRVR